MSGRIDLDEALRMWLAGYRYRSIAGRIGTVLDDEQRQRWQERSNRWKAEHPERAREIHLRANRAFRARQREKAS